nr:hypothetical protein CFP56_36452 [Quercus suber]
MHELCDCACRACIAYIRCWRRSSAQCFSSRLCPGAVPHGGAHGKGRVYGFSRSIFPTLLFRIPIMNTPGFSEVQQKVLDHERGVAFPCIFVGCAGDVPQDRFIAAIALLQRTPDKHRLTRQDVWTLAIAFLCEEVHATHTYGRQVEKGWREDFSHIDFRLRRTSLEPNPATPKRPIASTKRHASGPSRVARSTASPPTVGLPSPTPGARRKSCPERPYRRATSSASPATPIKTPPVSSPESSQTRYASPSQARPEQHVTPRSSRQASSSLDAARMNMSNPPLEIIVLDHDSEVAQHESRCDDTMSIGSSSDDSEYDQSFDDSALQDMVAPAVALQLSNAEDPISTHQSVSDACDFFRRRFSDRPPEAFRGKVFKLLKKPILDIAAPSTYIYAIPHLDPELTYVKIGISIKTHDRFHELFVRHKCRHIDEDGAWTLGETLTGAEAKRLEKLVHCDLAYHRHTLSQPDGLTIKNHTEWFQVDLQTAKRTIKLWRKIMVRHDLRPNTILSQELRTALNLLKIRFGKLAKRKNVEDWQRVHEDHEARIQWWTDLLLDSPELADHDPSSERQTSSIARTDTPDHDVRRCPSCTARISSTTIRENSSDLSTPPPSTQISPLQRPPPADPPAPSQAQASTPPAKSHPTLTLTTALPWLLAIVFVTFLPQLLNVSAFVAWILQVLIGMSLCCIAWLHSVGDNFVAS